MDATQSLDEIKGQYLSALRELARQDSKKFVQIVCWSLLTYTKSAETLGVVESSHPLLPRGEMEDIEWISRRWKPYQYLASMILRLEDDKASDCGEYVLIRDWIELRLRNIYGWFVNPNEICSESVSEIFDMVMSSVRSSFETEVNAAAEMIGNGIPVFEIIDKEFGYKLVAESDAHLSFVRMLGAREEAVNYRQPPDWADRFYLHRRHIEMHDIVFQWVDGDRGSAKKIQRTAFQGALAADGYHVCAIESDGDGLGKIQSESSIDLPDCGDGEKRKPGRRDHQIDAILAVCAALGFDSLSIPTGGKAAIKRFCLLGKRLFTDDGFDDAWKEARKRELVRMAEQEKFSPL